MAKKQGFESTYQADRQPQFGQQQATGAQTPGLQGATGQTSPVQAKQQLERSNQQFLEEIGQLAQQIQQKSNKEQVKQAAGQITQYCNQIRTNQGNL